MADKSKLTKEVVAQEARFILDNLLSAGQYTKEVALEELRRLCEQSVSLRLADYVAFLERFGYITFDRNTQVVSVTADGERVVAGEKVAELVIDVVHHFRPVLSRMRSDEMQAVSSAAGARKATDSRDIVDGRYEKVRAIGSGGIGTVYVARQTHLNRPVALKEIRELFGFFTEPQRMEIIKRFDEEALRAAALSHPNVAAIIDGNTSRDYPYLVTELLGGGSLRRLLRFAESIPPELAVKVFLQILHGLRHAHGKGVVHRGLKPENILFDAAGNVRITDFGISRVVERDQAVIQHVYVGMGSVAYMAPELYVDPQNVGPQTDLYALGIILYEMLARKLPGRRSPMPTKLHPTLPKIVDDLFDRLTQDDKNDRFKTVDEVLEDFHKAEASKAFVEPRAVMLFVESQVAKLQLKEEAGKEESVLDILSSLPEQGRPERAREDAGRSGSAVEPAPAGMAAASAAVRPTSTGPLAAVLSGASAPEVPLPPEEAVDESMCDIEYEDGTDRPKRRSRAHRPYSFQQRLKDRDK
jgi:serine/threonine protein kinase